jgi:HTH-type transcriptional regulator, competence development regulator
MGDSLLGLTVRGTRQGVRIDLDILSLRELAQLADIDHAYIYRLETGAKESPSDEVLTKLIRALKAGKRETEMLRYLAAHAETDAALVAHVLKDPTVTYEIFAPVAGAVFRGTARPDYPKLIERVRRILSEENGRG